jgi:hypothetical protein
LKVSNEATPAAGAVDPGGIDRFRVGAWIYGRGFGRFTVAPGVLRVDPGFVTRHVRRLRGCFEHRGERVVVVESPLFFGVRIVLLASTATDTLVFSPLLSRKREVTFAILATYPWQTTRVLAAIRRAGFDVQIRRRWIYLGIRPIR